MNSTVLSGDVHMLCPETDDYEQQLFIIVFIIFIICSALFGVHYMVNLQSIQESQHVCMEFLESMYLAFFKKNALYRKGVSTLLA